MEINSHATTYSEFVLVFDVHSDDVGMTQESSRSVLILDEAKTTDGRLRIGQMVAQECDQKCSCRKKSGDTEGPDTERCVGNVFL